MSALLDELLLAELAVGVGNKALLDELLDHYRDELPVQLANLRAAVELGCADTCRKAAHALRSGAAMLGAVRLAEAAGQLERSGDERLLPGVALVAADTVAALAARRP